MNNKYEKCDTEDPRLLLTQASKELNAMMKSCDNEIARFRAKISNIATNALMKSLLTEQSEIHGISQDSTDNHYIQDPMIGEESTINNDSEYTL